MENEIPQHIEKNIHKTKIFYRFIMAGITVAIIFGFYVAFLVFWPYKPLEILSPNPLEIVNENKTVRVGEEIEYRISYCRNTDQQARVTRTLHDGMIYILPELWTNTGTGCHNDAIISTSIVPKTLPPGKYFLHLNVQFQVNKIRMISYTLMTEEFTVIK